MLRQIATGFSSLLLSRKSEKPSKIIDEIEAFQKMKRLRPSRANFVDAFRWNAVLKRRTKKWGGKFIKIERFFCW